MKARWTALFVAAVTLRAFYLWFLSLRLPFLRQPVVDGAFFDARARALLASGWPAGPFDVPPGYPGFLAGVYRVLGAGPLSGALVQALLGAVTIVLAAMLAERLFDRRTGVMTGLLLLGTASLPFHESKLLPSALASFLVLLFTLLTVAFSGAYRGGAERRALERARADGVRPPRATPREQGLALAAGFCGGLALLVHPALGLAVGAVALWRLIEGWRGSRAISPGVAFVAAALLALLPATLHNAASGALAPISTDSGFNSWLALTRPPVDAALSPRSGERLALRGALADSLELRDLGSVLDPGQASGYWGTRFVTDLARAPIEGLGHLAARGGAVFLRREPGSSGSLRLETARIPVLAAAALPFNFLMLVGLLGLVMAAGRLGAPRGTSGTLVVAAWVPLSLLLGIVLSPGDAGERVILAPLAAIFAAHALSRLDGAWQAGRRGESVAAVVLVLAGLVLTWQAPAGAPAPARHDGALYVEVGRGLEVAGRSAEAAAAWRDALRVDPNGEEAALLLGQQALKQRNLAGALQWFERAVTLKPRRFDARNNLGILYYQARRMDEAAREMEAARALRPTDAAPWFYLGLIAQQGGELGRADSLLGEAITRDPRFPGGWIRRIEVSLLRGQPDLARSLADSAGARGIALPVELARRIR